MGSVHSKKKNEPKTENVKNEPKIVNNILEQPNQKEETQENKQIDNNLSTEQEGNNNTSEQLNQKEEIQENKQIDNKLSIEQEEKNNISEQLNQKEEIQENKQIDNNLSTHQKENNNISEQFNQKEEIQEINQIDNKLSTEQKKNNIKISNNELKIELFPDRKARNEFETESLKKLINKDTLSHSLDINKELAYINSNVPVLNGFYHAHINHRSLRIKPDDIWLLIVQAFSNHVNANAEKLRNKFVNFEGQKKLVVNYPLSGVDEVGKETLEDFSEQINGQMKKYLGEELLNILTPNFTTTDKDKIIIFKISIMGAFQKYFKYIMSLMGCGIPYLIIEGTAEDYEKIYSKTKELRKYDFEWYIDRILPIIQKFIEAKNGNVDVEFFKNIVQDKYITEYHAGISGSGGSYDQVQGIKGWILKFFAYYNSMEKYQESPNIFKGEQIKIKILKI